MTANQTVVKPRQQTQLADEASSTNDSRTVTTCPECDSSALVTDETHAERVCNDCGLVLNSDQIDHGPEWRAAGSEEFDQKSRVGTPVTNLMHDKGLSTNIGWKNQDANGNPISKKRRAQVERMRMWNERCRAKTTAERNLMNALGEINRMASALGIPNQARETAAIIYRRAVEENMIIGRAIESMATAAVYAAARQCNIPRSFDELEQVSQMERLDIERAYTYMVRELGLDVPLATAEDYLPRICSNVGVSDETRREARQLIEETTQVNWRIGKNPIGVAAGAVYTAVQSSSDHITQEQLHQETGMSCVTIRKRYQQFSESV